MRRYKKSWQPQFDVTGLIRFRDAVYPKRLAYFQQYTSYQIMYKTLWTHSMYHFKDNFARPMNSLA